MKHFYVFRLEFSVSNRNGKLSTFYTVSPSHCLCFLVACLALHCIRASHSICLCSILLTKFVFILRAHCFHNRNTFAHNTYTICVYSSVTVHCVLCNTLYSVFFFFHQLLTMASLLSFFFCSCCCLEITVTVLLLFVEITFGIHNTSLIY